MKGSSLVMLVTDSGREDVDRAKEDRREPAAQ